jgi:hypothetical protein
VSRLKGDNESQRRKEGKCTRLQMASLDISKSIWLGKTDLGLPSPQNGGYFMYNAMPFGLKNASAKDYGKCLKGCVSRLD